AASMSGESAAPPDDLTSVEIPQPDCKEFQNLIEKTYTFKPTKLTADQQTAKSAEMDVVWEKVKADKKLLPCLTAALESPTANAFFRFDGSTLLYSLDKSDETKR